MRKIFSVTELNGQIKRILEENFDLFWVQGEVSNLHRPASGHIYFTLKDEKSQIRAVIFRSTFGKRPFPRAGAFFEIENGMSILCRAGVSVYQPRGEYQLMVENIEPVGVGALQKAFEQVKARLMAEGLFDPSVKRPLPFIPRRIGVITSPTGAVIRDILHVTGRRFPSVDIRISPVRVQGTEAANDIIQALGHMHAQGEADVIILARGGGSLEDLAPFNDEGVARAISSARIPVISAIGHETDFTIADFVADLRAPTPSAAAELVVPVRNELAAAIQDRRLRLINSQRRLLERYDDKRRSLEDQLPSPRRQIKDLRLSVAAGLDRLQMMLERRIAASSQTAATLTMSLKHRHPGGAVREYRHRVLDARRGMGILWERKMGVLKQGLEANMTLLDALSPFSVLRRGYSITKTVPAGLLVREAALLRPGDEVDVSLADGGFQATVLTTYGSGKGWQRKNSRRP